MKMIKRTEISRPAVTYNLHVKDHHNYIANGAVVANCHTAKGKELRDLLTGHFAGIPIRWGLTGTIPPEDHESICLLASLGPVVGKIRAVDLQEKGVLANCHIEIVQLIDDHVEFNDYETEHKFLVRDSDRLQAIAGMVKQWTTENGNTLVLVDRIETGEILQQMLPDSVFIFGEITAKKRQKEYKSIQEATGKIIVATYGTMQTGINIPRLFNLVIIEAGKSFIRTIQSAGRMLRKAHDKDFADIYDVCSSLKFSRRHLSKRKAFYRDAEYPFDMRKIKYI